MNSTSISVAIISAFLSGIVGVVISTLYHRRYDRRKQKRDVLRRFVGNRYVLTGRHMGNQDGEPFIALNETFVVFADSHIVIAALKKMHQELGQPNRLSDNVVTLTKEMAKAAGVKIEGLNDDFIERPFTPGARSLNPNNGN